MGAGRERGPDGRESAVALHAVAARRPRGARRPALLLHAPPSADERFRAAAASMSAEKPAAAEMRSSIARSPCIPSCRPESLNRANGRPPASCSQAVAGGFRARGDLGYRRSFQSLPASAPPVCAKIGRQARVGGPPERLVGLRRRRPRRAIRQLRRRRRDISTARSPFIPSCRKEDLNRANGRPPASCSQQWPAWFRARGDLGHRRSVSIAACAARERPARRSKTKSPGARRRAAESVCGSDCAAAPFAHELKRSPATHITPPRCAHPSGAAPAKTARNAQGLNCANVLRAPRSVRLAERRCSAKSSLV